MVLNKLSLLHNKTKQLRKATLVVGGSLLMTGFMACNSGPQYELSQTLDPTQGVITEVTEVEKDVFRITDETVVPLKADSRIIAEYMDGIRDTFTLEEMKLLETEGQNQNQNQTQTQHHYHGSGMNGVLMGGMMGYMMGRSLSSPINRAAYANQGAYQKSTGSSSSMRSSATRRSVSKPKSGFGGSRSTRSYGG